MVFYELSRTLLIIQFFLINPLNVGITEPDEENRLRRRFLCWITSLSASFDVYPAPGNPSIVWLNLRIAADTLFRLTIYYQSILVDTTAETPS